MKVQICFAIIKILNNTPKISAQKLAYELGISTRSVYRYIDEITINGIPVNVDRGRYGGISLEEEYKKSKNKLIV